MTISLCMIVKNEEDILERCLKSAESITEEIIIVDTGSSDNTKEIASKFTKKIYDFEWINDFSAARNFSFEQAKMDYIMWLDADDIILPDDIAKLVEFKKRDDLKFDIAMMKYNVGYDYNGNINFSYFRERLIRRGLGLKWLEPVHEYIELRGKIINTDISITHAKQHRNRSTRNIEIYESNMSAGKEISPRGMYYYARELREHNRHSDAIKWFNLFLDSKKGWLEDNITACEELAFCYEAKKKPEDALKSLMRSFEYDLPRAEICCHIGYFFKARKRYRLAVFWFEMVLSLKKDTTNWGFSREECWGYVPCIECAVCYDKLGQTEKASKYNDMAGNFKPNSSAVLLNREYFRNKLKS